MGFDPTFVASGAGHRGGSVPDPGATAGTTRTLREDGLWEPPTLNNVLSSHSGAINLTQHAWTPITSFTPAAGLWLLSAQVEVSAPSGAVGASQTMAIVAGGTHLAGGDLVPSVASTFSGTLAPIPYTADGSTTVALQIYTDQAGLQAVDTPVNGGGKASYLTGVQIG